MDKKYKNNSGHITLYVLCIFVFILAILICVLGGYLAIDDSNPLGYMFIGFGLFLIYFVIK